MLPKLLFICILISSLISTAHSYNNKCLRHQEILLLQLKHELIFDSSLSTKLVRWNESDECCKWNGVECDASGYVVTLHLDDEAISGGIGDSSSLFRFKYLQKLNLAYNYFNDAIPKGIGNLTYLTHLNLSHAGFVGQVPSEISLLTELASLDISSDFRRTLSLEHPNLEMLVHNLTGLKELYLDHVNITSSHERRKWSHIVSSYLPNLTTLSLTHCFLSGPLERSFWQLRSLSILRLDHNDLSSVSLLDLMSSFPSLTTLTLAKSRLKGSIPSTFANLTKLVHVDLSRNFFSGSLSPAVFKGHSNLVHLDLSNNSFSGNIPRSLFGLPSLLELDLSYNHFHGTFQLANFRSLPNLTLLSLSYNRLSVVDVGNVNSTRVLQLKVLYLASCNLSKFPDLIKHLDLELLDLSNNHIVGEIPSWIWRRKLLYLDLSFNLLTNLQKPYNIPASLKFLYIHSTQLRGELHLPIPLESKLWYLFLANNSLSGSIPTSLCNATNLYALDLSRNKLSGSIPPCLVGNIRGLRLGKNNLSGSIPHIFSRDCRLQYLELNNNALTGKIPKSLERCTWLELMNVGNNNINDSFPCMLSSRLRVLVLHSNTFYGEVRCHRRWENLQVLDISLNHFSGSLESIDFSSWRAMVLSSDEQSRHRDRPMWISSRVTLVMKGLKLEFHRILPDFDSIDFSCNDFIGEIPKAIGDLTSLYHLNLSHNALNGSIPQSFGRLSELESLDLSRNQLTGPIPMGLGELTFLEVLNLSYNKLVGMIPKGRQFQTFSIESFEGNPGLCGFPLNRSCSHTGELSLREHEDVEAKREIEWEYVFAAFGYVVGFGSIVWLLLLCRRFREKYFSKIEEVVENIFIRRDMRMRCVRMVARNQVRDNNVFFISSFFLV